MLNSGHTLSPTTPYIQLVKSHSVFECYSGFAKILTVNPPAETGCVPCTRQISTVYYSTKQGGVCIPPLFKNRGLLHNFL